MGADTAEAPDFGAVFAIWGNGTLTFPGMLGPWASAATCTLREAGLLYVCAMMGSFKKVGDLEDAILKVIGRPKRQRGAYPSPIAVWILKIQIFRN